MLFIFFLAQPQTLAEALEVDDLPLSQEADDVVDIWVITETQDIVIGEAGFLLCCQVLCKVSDDVARGLDRAGAPGEARSCRGIDAGGVVYKIGGKGRGVPYLLVSEVPGQLMDDGGYHLHMAQLLSADVGEQSLCLGIRHRVALGQIAHGCAQLPVGTAVLQ